MRDVEHRPAGETRRHSSGASPTGTHTSGETSHSHFIYSFDNSLHPWRVSCNSPCGHACGALRLGRENETNGFAMLSAVCLSVVWIETALRSSETAFDISFDTRGLRNYNSCIPLLYAGRRQPVYPAHFTTDFQAFADRWQTHRFSLAVPQFDYGPGYMPDTLVVAIGFANLEAERAEATIGQQIGIDNVHIVPVAPRRSRRTAR